jgi:hypothetical protein
MRIAVSSAMALCSALLFGCGQQGPPDKVTGAEVGPAGGQFEIDGFKVVVPEGALEKPTYLTLKTLEPTQDSKANVELGPEGITFKKPVNISYQAPEGTDVSGAKLAFWGPRGWRPVPYADPLGYGGYGGDFWRGGRFGLAYDYDCRADTCFYDRDCFGGEVCGYRGGYRGCFRGDEDIDIDYDVDIDDDGYSFDYDVDIDYDDHDFDCDCDCDGDGCFHTCGLYGYGYSRPYYGGYNYNVCRNPYRPWGAGYRPWGYY